MGLSELVIRDATTDTFCKKFPSDSDATSKYKITVLLFQIFLQELMTVFQLLHWNGSLKAMRERQCSRQVRDAMGEGNREEGLL
jgi:hypothetical protein